MKLVKIGGQPQGLSLLIREQNNPLFTNKFLKQITLPDKRRINKNLNFCIFKGAVLSAPLKFYRKPFALPFISKTNLLQCRQALSRTQGSAFSFYKRRRKPSSAQRLRQRLILCSKHKLQQSRRSFGS